MMQLLREGIEETVNVEEKRPSVRLSSAHGRELGEELRRARHRARMSSEAVARAMEWSVGKLSKLESGSRGAGKWDIASLLGRYHVNMVTRERIMTIAAELDTRNFLRLHDRSPDDLAALSVHERHARGIAVYEPLIIPALAQTEDYAVVMTGGPNAAAIRMDRQRALRARRDRETVFYIHEAALGQTVGAPRVMRDQLLHLTLMATWDKTRVRIVPQTGRFHPTLRGPATLLTFDSPLPPLAYVETDTDTVFHDDPWVVGVYQHKMTYLDTVALDAEESRQTLARWARTYARSAA
ncbi:MAG: helix-turn-helix domain-containing protein [Saccharothrix sp.]|nr:helix-turn-helix domain-containing protein [Saccharothrix sp.]